MSYIDMVCVLLVVQHWSLLGVNLAAWKATFWNELYVTVIKGCMVDVTITYTLGIATMVTHRDHWKEQLSCLQQSTKPLSESVLKRHSIFRLPCDWGEWSNQHNHWLTLLTWQASSSSESNNCHLNWCLANKCGYLLPYQSCYTVRLPRYICL